jgi:uridylate kinase
MDESEPLYKRILLKISGESLQGKRGSGFSESVLKRLVEEIKKVHNLDIEIGIVVGGGNFFRGRESENSVVNRTTSDYIGMLATIMNGLALCDALEKENLSTKLISALPIEKLTEPVVTRKVKHYLSDKRIVVFTAGTGSPFFTTDTGAALRAIEIEADVFLKATKVDGVYDGDPHKKSDASKFEKISYNDFIAQDLKVIDMTSVILSKENDLKIKVFNIYDDNSILNAVISDKTGTIIGK